MSEKRQTIYGGNKRFLPTLLVYFREFDRRLHKNRRRNLSTLEHVVRGTCLVNYLRLGKSSTKSFVELIGKIYLTLVGRKLLFENGGTLLFTDITAKEITNYEYYLN